MLVVYWEINNSDDQIKVNGKAVEQDGNYLVIDIVEVLDEKNFLDLI